MSSSRSTVSAEPTTSSSTNSRDEEKVRCILRDLRQKNVNLEQDILKLEKALTEPAYNKIVEKIYSSGTATNNTTTRTTPSTLPTLQKEAKHSTEDEDNAVRVDTCRKFITPKVNWMIKKKKQKLAFGLVNITVNRPELYVCPSQPFTLSIVGPKDLKKEVSLELGHQL